MDDKYIDAYRYYFKVLNNIISSPKQYGIMLANKRKKKKYK